MRKTLCATALITIALLGAGCKKGPDIVGKWNASADQGSVDLEFKSDNTFTMGAKVGPMTMTSSGDYKLEGEKLSLTLKDVQIPGVPPAKLAEAKKSPEFSKPKEATIKFASDDEMTITGLAAAPTGGAGQTVKLTRVKA